MTGIRTNDNGTMMMQRQSMGNDIIINTTTPGMNNTMPGGMNNTMPGGTMQR